jgi:cell division protein FtsA
MAQSIVLGLDIGSQRIKAVIAEASKEKMRLIAGFVRPSAGLRRGVVVEMDELIRALTDLFSEIKLTSKSALKNIHLNVDISDSRCQTSKGIIAVARANSEIHEDDIERVIQASQAIGLPNNRMILHNITREFIVDGVSDIRDPLGMLGSRLEVSSLIIDAFSPAVKNLTKCVGLAGGSVSGLYFSPLSAAEAALTKNQKELGVVLIDIGFSTTGYAIFEENKLLRTRLFPVGAGHITNDLAIALKVPVETAEKIKTAYGYALAKEVPGKESVDLKKIDSNASGSPSKKFIAEIIESRAVEIFELVNDELKEVGKAGRLPAGAVIVGGGAKLPGITDLAKQELRLASQVGLPNVNLFEVKTEELADYVESPDYAVSLGLTLLSRERGKTKPREEINFITRFVRNLLP